MVEIEVDARAALQALFAANRPRTPGGSLIVDEGKSPSRANEGEHESGRTLRRRLKDEMSTALVPPASTGRLKELEGQVSKLLDQVSSGSSYKPLPRPSRSKSGVDAEIQTVAAVSVRADIEDPVRPTPAPALSELKRPRLCVVPDRSENAATLRNQLQQAQKDLLRLDTETTKLTRELKLLRIAHWDKSRRKSATEHEIRDFFADCQHELRSNGANLQDDLAAKQKELAAAHQTAKHWSKMARRMDHELQQTIRPPEHQRILSKHPAGEVFWTRMDPGSDSDSDDDYYRATPKGGEVQLASSDEDQVSGGGRPLSSGEKSPPPPPSQQWRSVNPGDGANESDGSVTSPSSQSGSGLSPSGDVSSLSRPSGGAMVSGKMQDESESASSDDENGKGARPAMITKQDSGVWPKSQGDHQAGKVVPPLPSLSGLSGNEGSIAAVPKATPAPKVAAALDEAEEVSSEDIYSQEGSDSSRSQSV